VLFLVFETDGHRYAIDAGQIVEVLPLVAIDAIAGAPVDISGVLLYRGVPIPVVDLTQVLAGRPVARRLSTRIVVVRTRGADGQQARLGLLAERATETMRRSPGDFVESGVRQVAGSCAGPVATDHRGLVQRLDVEKLVAAHHQTLLGSSELECRSQNSSIC